MTTNRHERRANPDQWWKLVAYFDGSTKTVHGLDEKFSQYVKGTIDDIVVIEVPTNLPPQERLAIMQGFREMAAGMGEEHRFMIVPDNIRFLRVVPVDRDTTRQLEHRLKVRRVEASVRTAKADVADQNPGSGEEPTS